MDLSAAATRAPNSWLDPLDIFKIIMRGCCWLRVVAWYTNLHHRAIFLEPGARAARIVGSRRAEVGRDEVTRTFAFLFSVKFFAIFSCEVPTGSVLDVLNYTCSGF